MALFSLRCKNFGTQPFPIIADTQPELLSVIADLDLDLFGLGVQKSIAEGLKGNFVDVVTNNRVQVSR